MEITFILIYQNWKKKKKMQVILGFEYIMHILNIMKFKVIAYEIDWTNTGELL